MMKKTTLLTVLAMFICLVYVDAQVIASESFDYPAGTNIKNVDGGSGWGGAFVPKDAGGNPVDESQYSAEVVADGLVYPVLATSGGALKITTPAADGPKFFRDYASPLFEANTTVWMSYLFQSENTLGGNGQVWLQPIGNISTGQNTGFGWHWNGSFKTIEGPAGNAIVGGRCNLLVVRFECTNTTVTASYWDNPLLDVDAADQQPFAVLEKTRETASNLIFWASYGSEVVYIDELKIGHTFQDVASMSGSFVKYEVAVQVNDSEGQAAGNASVTAETITGTKEFTTDANGYVLLDSLIEGRDLKISATKEGHWGVQKSVFGSENVLVTLQLHEEEAVTTNPKVILYTPTHPDDELFGANITFSKYCKLLGHTGYYVMSTTGNYTYDANDAYYESALRRDEAERSANFFDAEARFMCQKDGATKSEEVAERMCRMIRELQPDIVITHATNGEYGHKDHVQTSLGVTAAVTAAADSTMYPEQLENGLKVWDTPKFYRQVANYNNWASDEPISTIVNGLVGPFEELMDMSLRDYSVYAMENSHIHAMPAFGGFDWGNTYPVPNEHSLHLVRVAGDAALPTSEKSILDGLSNEKLQNYSFVKDWLLLGPFYGDINEEFVSNEANINAVKGQEEGDEVWKNYSINSFKLDSKTPIDNRGMENRNNVDFKEFYGYRPELVSNAVVYAYNNYTVANDTTVTLGLTAHDYYKVYVNGHLVASRDENTGYILWDMEDRIHVHLNAGDNKLLVKVASRDNMKNTDVWNVLPTYNNTPYFPNAENARAWSFSLKVNPVGGVLSNVTFNATENNTPLEGINVRFNGLTKSTATNGTVVFENVFNSGVAAPVIANATGFEEYNSTVVVNGSNSFDINLGKSSALASSEVTSFNMYPNPASSILNITIENYKGDRVQLYTLSGMLVLESNMLTSTQAINISALSTGVYLVKVGETKQILMVK